MAGTESNQMHCSQTYKDAYSERWVASDLLTLFFGFQGWLGQGQLDIDTRWTDSIQREAIVSFYQCLRQEHAVTESPRCPTAFIEACDNYSRSLLSSDSSYLHVCNDEQPSHIIILPPKANLSHQQLPDRDRQLPGNLHIRDMPLVASCGQHSWRRALRPSPLGQTHVLEVLVHRIVHISSSRTRLVLQRCNLRRC